MKTSEGWPIKAYKNLDFLNSPDARVVRILSEFLEPIKRFREHGIKDTIVFFGSSRIVSGSEAGKRLRDVKRKLARVRRPSSTLERMRRDAEIDFEMSSYYEDAMELSRLLTKWSLALDDAHRFVICSGGGPGIMEAANKGAKLAGGPSIGLNISLPFEQAANRYVTKELNFGFHYFFIRKFWFVYPGKALVIFPGGFGTLDELLEVLTLVQTRKIKKKMTVLIYGKKYWEEVLSFDSMARWHTITPADLKLFRFADSPKEAFRYLRHELTKNYLRRARSENK
ncbi:MAG: LOG family protein [Bacteroidota bacterium]